MKLTNQKLYFLHNSIIKYILYIISLWQKNRTHNSSKRTNWKIIGDDDKKKYFRISVKGGGCSGFKYDFSFDNNVDTNDVLFENVVIDKTSIDIIAGSVIDFKRDDWGDFCNK